MSDNVIRLPGTEDLFTANPKGAVGIFPSGADKGSWGTVHVSPRGTAIALGSSFLRFDDAYSAAERWATALGAELLDGVLLP